MGRLWVDGVAGGSIPADDPGLLLGLTVFETMRSYGRRVFRIDRHLDRLETSAAQLDISLPDRASIVAEVTSVLGFDERIRYTLTAGGHRILDLAPIDKSRVCAPARVARVGWEPASFLPGAVKHGSRAAWIVAARRLGVDEVILVDLDGYMLEANRSNIFAVRNGVVVTPPLNGRCLAGVTRGALIEAAERAGIPLREAPLHRDERFDELYLSSTLKQLAPVVELDARPGPGGGPIGQALHAAFLGIVAEETAEGS